MPKLIFVNSDGNEKSIEADAEIISFAIDIMRSMGFSNNDFVINLTPLSPTTCPVNGIAYIGAFTFSNASKTVGSEVVNAILYIHKH